MLHIVGVAILDHLVLFAAEAKQDAWLVVCPVAWLVAWLAIGAMLSVIPFCMSR